MSWMNLKPIIQSEVSQKENDKYHTLMHIWCDHSQSSRARHLECEVKWALGSITMNKASGGDRIPVELFQILKDDAVKVLHSICQQI